MKGNDLDNFVVPRDIVVWEGLMGLLPDERLRLREAKFRERGKWAQAVALYTINEGLARRLWYLVWHHSNEVDLLTYHGREFAQALEKRIEREDLPFRSVWSEKPSVLARNIALLPHVRSIYDPDPNHQFLYGAKTRVLLPDDYNLFGSL